MTASWQKTRIKVDVLLNSPGVHDEVRIRRPYAELQRIGIDCRIHERPFRMRQCVRENSIVVWQRPLPESQELMIQNFFWFTQRGCLLLVDLDDHPGLFDKQSKNKMRNQKFANLRYCHGILTSNAHLAKELRKYNPSIYTVDNCPGKIKSHSELLKGVIEKNNSQKIRIFIANQNREKEHQSLARGLLKLLKKYPQVHLEIIADRVLGEKFSTERRTSHPRLNYNEYREVLSKCHIALAPLHKSIENRCKTVIKWQECTAEGVVLVGGPELYGGTLSKNVGVWIKEIDELIPATMNLIDNARLRVDIIKNAYTHLECNGWKEPRQALWHGWLMATLWKKRGKLDYYARSRLARRMEKKLITKSGDGTVR